jgi:hypothetical protein
MHLKKLPFLSPNQKIMVKLMDEENLLNEIVVSASRTQKDFLSRQ